MNVEPIMRFLLWPLTALLDEQVLSGLQRATS